jgi:DNA adenine methylase
MQYVGGKTMIARRVVQAILNDTPYRKNWFEPFVGGGNVLEHAAPHFTRSVAMDAHPDLILMWQAVASGHRPPEFVSREQYEELRRAEPSAFRGFAGFGASFGGKWFGGYGVVKVDRKHPNAEVCRSTYPVVVRQGAVFQDRGVIFRHGLFGSLTPPPGTVVYCDPPYAGTTGYSTGDFDHGLFYKTLGQWAQDGCAVYVSEYTAPEDVPYTVIWSREKRNVLEAGDNQRTVTEKLFRIGAPTCP